MRSNNSELLENTVHEENERPDWVQRAYRVLLPPEKLTVSEWAEKYRMLDPKTSAEPGPWKTSRVPYLREIMDSFSTPGLEEIVLCCSAQVGKTETLLNVLYYIMDQDPSPCLFCYPTIELAESNSKNRILPGLELMPHVYEKYHKGESKTLEYHLDGMFMVLSGANSPASLSSRAVRFLLLDELDKWMGASNREADPLSLAKERTKTFAHNKKIFMCSTPTIEQGHIWQQYKTADLQKQFYVPCPHCGHYQTFTTKQIKWPEECDKSQVRDVAWYECVSCQGVINDTDKPKMLMLGEWRVTNEFKGRRPRKVGYHLNAIYSPWVRFGAVADEFLNSKDFVDRLMNFTNSWEGLPWVDKATVSTTDTIYAKQGKHERGSVPEAVSFLTAGIDVQDGYFYWSVYGWGEGASSYLIDYGRADTWLQLENILINGVYKSKAGSEFMIARVGIDSGYDTNSVYRWCSRFAGVALPLKGSNVSLLGGYYKVSPIDRAGYGGLKLYVLDTQKLKDAISGRIKQPLFEPGSWHAFKNLPDEFARQMVSEQKVTRQDRKTGKIVSEWQPIGSHSANHYWDCCVYATGMAELLGAAYLGAPQQAETQLTPRQHKENPWAGEVSIF